MKIGANGKPEDLIGDEVRDEYEKIRESEKNTESSKRSFKDVLSNFWYFHKWSVLVGAIIIAGLLIASVQLALDAECDAYIMYVGKNTLYVVNKDTAASDAETLIDDVDGDGTTHVGLLEITVGIPGGDLTAYGTNSDAVQRFNTEVAAGESIIYILEESFYQAVRKQNILEKLSDIIPAENLPDDMYDEYGVRVKNLAFFTRDGWSAFPDDVILCIRKSPAEDELSYGRTDEYWQNNKKLLCAIFGQGERKAETVTLTDTSNDDIAICVYSSEHVYESDEDDILSALYKYIPDTVNDSKKTLSLTRIKKNSVKSEKFESEIESGTITVFLTDEETYEELKETQDILSLTEIFTYSNGLEETVKIPEHIVSKDGCGVFVKDVPLFTEKNIFGGEDSELVIYARKTSSESASVLTSVTAFMRDILGYNPKSTTK